MHKKILKDVSDEKLREMVDDIVSMIKETNHDLYDDIEMYLYKETYGCHFNEWMLECATKHMVNEDGTSGPHWTLEQTNNVARQNNLRLETYNEYDWNYVMNMIYSDYYGIVSNDLNVYYKMAKSFLDDKDAPEGKALKYYLAMKAH